MKRELVVLSTVLQFGLLGMTFGVLLGELGPKKARNVSLRLLLGLLALVQTDVRRTIGAT